MTLKSILVAFDGTAASAPALDQAGIIAKATGAQVTLVSAIPLMAGFGFVQPMGTDLEKVLAEARTELAAAKSRLEAAGVAHVAAELLQGEPVDEIVGYARRTHPDLIVVGTRGLGTAGRFLLGSVSDGILHHANASVLVVRPPGAPAGA
jgi:nucleotide-binding universal stress UspA family protein